MNEFDDGYLDTDDGTTYSEPYKSSFDVDREDFLDQGGTEQEWPLFCGLTLTVEWSVYSGIDDPSDLYYNREVWGQPNLDMIWSDFMNTEIRNPSKALELYLLECLGKEFNAAIDLGLHD